MSLSPSEPPSNDAHTPETTAEAQPDEDSLRSWFWAPPLQSPQEQPIYIACGIANILVPCGVGAIISGLVTKKRLLLRSGLLQLLLIFVGVGAICSIVYGVSMLMAAAAVASAAATATAADEEDKEAPLEPQEIQQQEQQQEQQQDQQQEQQQEGHGEQQQDEQIDQQSSEESLQRHITEDPIPYTGLQSRVQHQQLQRADLCILPSEDFVQ
ncbi:hypothetical protein, conserved [Eimeria acervulina]|uniref:Transmembrane protein n=1 Tax=Eimeria acervulina TaxID=5801 RepID=U6GHR6_EIMAC|nr:hypothetical protein, conserved [Eimeria acervulina]CDI78833.1 hypothetical protein, conserved [Eimeria acervulina]